MSNAVDEIAKMFSPEALRSGAMDIAQYVIWGVLALAVIIFAWKKWQDKKIFIYPVRIFRRRANGNVKEINTKGGYIKKGTITYFIVKISKFKKKEMDKLPNSSLMDEDNRIYFYQISPDAPYLQVRRRFEIEEILVPNEHFKEPSQKEKEKLITELLLQEEFNEEFKDLTEQEKTDKARQIIEHDIFTSKNQLVEISDAVYTPVPSDLKQQAMAEINNYKNMLGVDVNKQMAYLVGGLIVLGIIAIIIFYIAMNGGAVPILTD